MPEKFYPQHAYALGAHPDAPWQPWHELREEDLPAVLRGIPDAAHRREFADWAAGYRPYLSRGLTLGEAVAEVEVEVERQRLAAEGVA